MEEEKVLLDEQPEEVVEVQEAEPVEEVQKEQAQQPAKGKKKGALVSKISFFMELAFLVLSIVSVAAKLGTLQTMLIFGNFVCAILGMVLGLIGLIIGVVKKNTTGIVLGILSLLGAWVPYGVFIVIVAIF